MSDSPNSYGGSKQADRSRISSISTGDTCINTPMLVENDTDLAENTEVSKHKFCQYQKCT